MLRQYAQAIGILCALAVGAPLLAQRWQMQYLHDELRSSLSIVDIQFPSASHGIAVGYTLKGSSRKPVSMVTSDGGTTWQSLPLKDTPVSLFFLNDDTGWMVTDNGIWKTAESGKQWTRIANPRFDISRVYFVDENHGWAVGARAALQTTDGGRSWARIRMTSELPGDLKYTTFRWITFFTRQAGLILGSNKPPARDAQRRRDVPIWVDPKAGEERETPHLSFAVQTLDGGNLWAPSASSMFGDITRSRLNPSGKGIGLIEHAESFQVPSEVFHSLFPEGKTEIVFKDPKYFISDVWVTPGGVFYIAGIALTTRFHSVVPQRVKVMRSSDFKDWTLMDVDYRAIANRVYLAGAGENVWLATNNGTILKLTN